MAEHNLEPDIVRIRATMETWIFSLVKETAKKLGIYKAMYSRKLELMTQITRHCSTEGLTYREFISIVFGTDLLAAEPETRNLQQNRHVKREILETHRQDSESRERKLTERESTLRTMEERFEKSQAEQTRIMMAENRTLILELDNRRRQDEERREKHRLELEQKRIEADKEKEKRHEENEMRRDTMIIEGFKTAIGSIVGQGANNALGYHSNDSGRSHNDYEYHNHRQRALPYRDNRHRDSYPPRGRHRANSREYNQCRAKRHKDNRETQWKKQHGDYERGSTTPPPMPKLQKLTPLFSESTAKLSEEFKQLASGQITYDEYEPSKPIVAARPKKIELEGCARTRGSDEDYQNETASSVQIGYFNSAFDKDVKPNNSAKSVDGT